MRAIEVLGIDQARKWNVATLNEFRAFFGMAPHKTFKDISTQPGVADSLKTLYGSPDLVELYPGLVAEDAKDVKVPGAGLCPGFTISKAILSDAVALVRGDRFYTVVCLAFPVPRVLLKSNASLGLQRNGVDELGLHPHHIESTDCGRWCDVQAPTPSVPRLVPR